MATGFGESTEIYEYVCSGKKGRILTIKCAIARQENPWKTTLHAIKVASKIFSLILNPEDEDIERSLYQEFDWNMVEAVKDLHKDLELDPERPYLLVRLKLRGEWVKARKPDGSIGRVELITPAVAGDRPGKFHPVKVN